MTKKLIFESDSLIMSKLSAGINIKSLNLLSDSSIIFSNVNLLIRNIGNVHDLTLSAGKEFKKMFVISTFV